MTVCVQERAEDMLGWRSCQRVQRSASCTVGYKWQANQQEPCNKVITATLAVPCCNMLGCNNKWAITSTELAWLELTGVHNFQRYVLQENVAGASTFVSCYFKGPVLKMLCAIYWLRSKYVLAGIQVFLKQYDSWNVSLKKYITKPWTCSHFKLLQSSVVQYSLLALSVCSKYKCWLLMNANKTLCDIIHTKMYPFVCHITPHASH